MRRLRMNLDPFANDIGRWGASLVNNAELLFGCLDTAEARSVVEVGAYAGDLTRVLLEWGARVDARVWAIDPLPQPELVQLARDRDDLELVRMGSHDGLQAIPLPDAAIIDGDHNYYTVSEELRIIAERSAGGRMPLLLFHDVCWPHARRDDYYTPDEIPEEMRQPIAEGGGLSPEEEGIFPGGLPYRHPAAREGGPQNGVLTAVEDFVAGHEGLELAVVSSFFGLGVIWDRSAPYAAAVAELLEPYAGNPLLERLEANRVLHLTHSHYQLQQVGIQRARTQRLEAILYKLLESKTFTVAERLSTVRQGGEPAFSKEEIRAALAQE